MRNSSRGVAVLCALMFVSAASARAGGTLGIPQAYGAQFRLFAGDRYVTTQNNVVSVWDAEKGRNGKIDTPLAQWTCPVTSGITSVSASADGDYIAITGYFGDAPFPFSHGYVGVFKTETGREAFHLASRGGVKVVPVVTFSPINRTIVASVGEGVFVWHGRRGHIETLADEIDESFIFDMSISGNGRVLAVSDINGTYLDFVILHDEEED